MLDARAWILPLLAASLACRPAPGGVAESVPMPSELDKVMPIELSATVVHEVVLAGDKVLLVGQRRASAVGSHALIALVDRTGRLRWTATLDGPFSWAETARIDPHGTIYVFGRRAGGTGWLWRLDPEGRELGLDILSHAELLGFELAASQVQVFVGSRDIAAAEMSATWLGFDWLTGTSSTRNWVWIYGDSGDEPEVVVLGADLFEFDGDLYRLPTTSVHRLDSLDAPEAEQARAHPRTPVIAHEAVDVPVGEPVSLEFGEEQLWIVQLPPQSGADARTLLVRAEPASQDRLRAWLDSVSGVPRQLDVDPNDPWAWAWVWPLVEQPTALELAQQLSLGAWLLDAVDCEPIDLLGSCDQQDLVYPVPASYDPLDPCWMLGQIETVIAAIGREAVAKNFEKWLALLEALYLEGNSPGVDDDANIAWTPRDTIIDRLIELGFGERLIRAMVLDFDEGTLAASEAASRLADLPVDTAVPLARELVEALRDESSRCEDVRALVDFIESRGFAAPVWSADLRSECDIYYVLCTGLQPGLEQLVTGLHGFEIVEVCADDRPQEAQIARDLGLEVCTPTITREPRFWYDLALEAAAEIAASCGTSAALAELRYTCGVLFEFEVYRYESSLGPDGRVRIDKLEILHTTAS